MNTLICGGRTSYISNVADQDFPPSTYIADRAQVNEVLQFVFVEALINELVKKDLKRMSKSVSKSIPTCSNVMPHTNSFTQTARKRQIFLPEKNKNQLIKVPPVHCLARRMKCTTQ